MKDKIIIILTAGIILILAMLVIGDFIISLKENRPADDSIVHLVQVAIAGIIGIVGGYLGNSNNNNSNNNNKN
jgi:uncharacterized membrane protein